MIEESLKIVKFSFEQNCYDNIDDRYSFVKDGADYKISYTNIYMPYGERKLKTIDYNEFNKGILSIIKDWKRKYYPNPVDAVCDGLCWALKLKLSDGKYVYYDGHHETPENYDDLLRFLEKYFK